MRHALRTAAGPRFETFADENYIIRPIGCQ
jgi:hypothetical protein